MLSLQAIIAVLFVLFSIGDTVCWGRHHHFDQRCQGLTQWGCESAWVYLCIYNNDDDDATQQCEPRYPGILNYANYDCTDLNGRNDCESAYTPICRWVNHMQNHSVLAISFYEITIIFGIAICMVFGCICYALGWISNNVLLQKKRINTNDLINQQN